MENFDSQISDLLGRSFRPDDIGQFVVALFENVICPQIVLSKNGLIDIPEYFTIQMKRSARIYKLLSNPQLFCSLPELLQKGILDVLHLVMIRGTYDVIRFQCHGMDDLEISTSISSPNLVSTRSFGLIRILLMLLEKVTSSSSSIGVAKRIIHLLGLTSAAGISTGDLRDVLILLRDPSELSLSLLQALKTMIRHDNAIVKAAPASFFNLGGYGAGIVSARSPFPFSKEYQFFTWFRVENFAVPSTSSTARDMLQHIVSIVNEGGYGIDVYIKDGLVHVSLAFVRGSEPQIIVLSEVMLKRGVWYHFCIRHAKPRINLFSRDELVIHIDHQVVFKDTIRYPSQLSLLDDVEFAIGRHFDGQISPVYFFAETLAPLVVETLARIDAGKPFEGLNAGLNNVTADLLPSLTTADRKCTPIYSKVVVSYHPGRCVGDCALDIFSSRHALLGPLSQAWSITSARDVLNSIGGVSCLLPMFPRLLIDNGVATSSSSESSSCATSISTKPLLSALGSGWGCPADPAALALLESSAQAYLQADIAEAENDTCVGLLLTILAKTITTHRIYQTELLNMAGVEMIEYALTCVPIEILQAEGEGCILSLLLLRSATTDFSALECRVSKRLLCNFSIWSRSSYQLQSALMKVLLAAIRAQPAHFLSIVGVYALLESMSTVYAHVPDGLDPAFESSVSPAQSVHSSFKSSLQAKATFMGSPDGENADSGGEEFVDIIPDPAEGIEAIDVIDPEQCVNSANQEMTTRDSVPGGRSLSMDSEGEGLGGVYPSLSSDHPQRLGEPQDSSTSLNNYQRRRLRVCIQAMIMVLVSHSGHAREVQPLLDFTACQRDLTMVNEVAQMLLCLLVEGGSKIISAITESCHGAEEFASFVLRYLVHRPSEELRCTGIRLVTHFYLRVDLLPASLVTKTLKRRKGSLFQRTMEQVALLSGGQGMQRLNLCGGFALLAEVLHSHCRSSGPATYHALLEMLLTKPGAKSQVTVQYNSLFEEADSPMPPSPRGRTDTEPDFPHGNEGPRTVVFAAHYISPDQVHDESLAGLNTAVLPVFFELLPRLSLGEHTLQLYTDLLGLLKNSSGNREAFITCPAWHLCLYNLVIKLMVVHRDQETRTRAMVSTAEMCSELQRWAGIAPVALNEPPARSSNADSAQGAKFSAPKEVELPQGSHVDDDLCFALGMKLYSTLILHAVEHKSGGWREICRTLSQSFDSKDNKGVSSKEAVASVHTIMLSHLVSELAFIMQYKYKDLQRLARSHSSAENTEATDNIKNILSTIITVTQHSLYDVPCVPLGIPQLRVAQLRIAYLAQVVREESVRQESEELNGSTSFHERPDDDCLLEMADDLMLHHIELFQRKSEATNERAGGMKGEAARQNQDDSPNLHPHLGEFQSFSDLGHEWMSLSVESLDGTTDDAAHAKPVTSDARASKMKKNFSVSAQLQPLERGSTLGHGRLVLTLQTLRFFDSVFWPNEAGSIRNVPMLSFYKDEVATTGAQSVDDLALRPTTVFSSALRACLYVLHTLSPLTDLAASNLRRMHALTHVMESVSPYTTPVFDWLVSTVVHVTLQLQRIALALQPAFTLLGISSLVEISSPAVRSLSSQNREEAEEQRLVDEEDYFYRADGDPTCLIELARLFSTLPGENVLSCVRTCLQLLADAVENNGNAIAAAVDGRTAALLAAFVDRIQSEVPSQEASFLSAVDSTSSIAASEGMPVQQSSSASFAPVASDQSGLDVKPRTFSEMSDLSATETAMGERGQSESQGNWTNPASPRSRADSSFGSASALPNTDGSDPKEPSSLSPAQQGRIILRLLRLLRDPYMTSNLLRCPGVTNAITALELHEKLSMNAYAQELSVFSESLQAQRDFGKAMLEEMTELSGLSASVLKIMTYRQHTRGQSRKAEEMLTLKNVASQWDDCMRVFEGEWSPWAPPASTAQENSSSNELSTKSDPSSLGAQFELSQHKDFLLRRMLLTRCTANVDHSGAAYLEGKQRDQLRHELGLSRDALLPGEVDKESLATTDIHHQFSSILKNDLIKPQAEADWGDDDPEDDPSLLPQQQPLNNLLGAVQNLGLAGQGSDKRPGWARAFPVFPDERTLLVRDACQVTIDKVVAGVVLLTNKFLYFHPKRQVGGLANASKTLHDQRWHLDRLSEAYGRRHLLQNCAIELFFADAPEIFLAFNNLATLKGFFRLLRRQHVPLLTSPGYLKPSDLIARSPYTDLWRRRLISNFEYLMRLNLMAGRSYNDIAQYPVFPWIIADYTSTTLDLTNPSTFRDLAKPMGALNPTRLKEVLERYQSMSDTEPERRFMYGSHYSSAGVVLHYMIRQEPFTTLAVNLQGGRFDCPDRIFFDLKHTWHGVTTSMSDVKELVPEMYCCPEMFLNSNLLPLGALQDGDPVDDVVLPPWAADAFEFVRKNREALECDWVSERLHEWIDLIFGYKQRGAEAIAANNLFYYLTYEGAVDIDAIEDPLQREAAKAQVTHFGQTPSQLLTTPHVKRLPRAECMVPVCSDSDSLDQLVVFCPSKQFGYDAYHGSIVALQATADRLVCVRSDLTIDYYRWSSFPDGEGSPFTLRGEKSRRLPCASLSASEGALRGVGGLGTGGYKQMDGDARGRSATLGLMGAMGDAVSGGRDRAASSLAGVGEALKLGLSMTQSFFQRPFNVGSKDDVGAANIATSASPSQGPQSAEEGASRPPTPPSTDEALASTRTESSAVPSPSPPRPLPAPRPPLTLPSINSRHVALSLGGAIGDSGRLISCGYWDHTLKAHGLEPIKDLGSSSGGHVGAITCCAVGGQHGSHTVVSGGQDGTVRVWVLEGQSIHSGGAFAQEGAAGSVGVAAAANTTDNSESSIRPPAVGLVCVQSLWGHHSPVSCLSYSSELDLVFSGSMDGLLCLHTARKGRFVRSIPSLRQKVDLVLVASPGYLLAHCWTDCSMHLYWINGEPLVKVDVENRVEAMVVTGTGNVLICGLHSGCLSFRCLWSLDELWVCDLSMHGPVTSLRFTEDNQFLLVGSHEGILNVVTDPDARMRMLYAAIQKTPLLGAL